MADTSAGRGERGRGGGSATSRKGKAEDLNPTPKKEQMKSDKNPKYSTDKAGRPRLGNKLCKATAKHKSTYNRNHLGWNQHTAKDKEATTHPVSRKSKKSSEKAATHTCNARECDAAASQLCGPCKRWFCPEHFSRKQKTKCRFCVDKEKDAVHVARKGKREALAGVKRAAEPRGASEEPVRRKPRKEIVCPSCQKPCSKDDPPCPDCRKPCHLGGRCTTRDSCIPCYQTRIQLPPCPKCNRKIVGGDTAATACTECKTSHHKNCFTSGCAQCKPAVDLEASAPVVSAEEDRITEIPTEEDNGSSGDVGEDLSSAVDRITERMDQRREEIRQQLSSAVGVDRITSLVALGASYAFEDDVKAAQAEMSKISLADKRGTEPWAQSCILYQEGMLLLRKQPPWVRGARLKFIEIERTNRSFVLYHLGLASTYLEQKEFKDAFRKYELVLKNLGKYSPPIVRVGMAMCCLHLKKVEHARKCLERAVELDEEDVLAHHVLIATALQQKDIERVTKSILVLVELTPEDPKVLQLYVDSLYFKAMAEGEMTQAIQRRQLDLIQKSLELAAGSNDLIAYGAYQKGRLSHALGNFQDAKSHYQTALTKYPTLHAAGIALAKVHWKLGNCNEAFEMLRELAVALPGDVEVSRMLSVIYSEQGQHEEAARFAAGIATTDAAGTPEAWHLSAHVNRLDRQLSDKFLGNALKIEQSEGTEPSWESKCNRAVLNENLNELADCVQGIFGTNKAPLLVLGAVGEKARAKEHVGTLLNYSRLLIKGDPESAKVIALFVLKHHGGMPEPLFLLHTIAMEQKREKEAVTWMTLLFTVDKESPFSTAEVARIFLEKGSQKAGQFAHGVLQHGRQNSETGLTRETVHVVTSGILYLREARRRGQFAKLADAMSHFRGVLDQDRGNIVAAHGLACCTAMLGEPNVASSMFQRVIETRANDDRSQGDAHVHAVITDVMSGAYRSAVASAARSTLQLNNRQRSELAFANLSLENYDQALALLDEAIEEAQKAGNGTESQEGDCGKDVLSMLYYNKVIVLVTKATQLLKKKDASLTQSEGDLIKELLKESVTFAKLASTSQYKNDGKEAVLFMNDLLTQMRVLESNRQKAVNRGHKLAEKSQLLDQEWVATATEEKETREDQMTRERELDQAQREMRQVRTDDTFMRLRSLIDEQWQGGGDPEQQQQQQHLDFVDPDHIGVGHEAGQGDEETQSNRTKRDRGGEDGITKR